LALAPADYWLPLLATRVPPGRAGVREYIHPGLDEKGGLSSAERTFLVDVADASGEYVGDGTSSGLVPVVCPVGLSHRDHARAA